MPSEDSPASSASPHPHLTPHGIDLSPSTPSSPDPTSLEPSKPANEPPPTPSTPTPPPPFQPPSPSSPKPKPKPKQTFTCPPPACNAITFPTARLLMRHKSTSLFHEYCRKCDLDFASLEAKLIHLIESERHLACAECGEEFGCEDGLVRHVWRVS
ncbi:hypothetical protein EPUS_07689 [Endocarpon pusillum Z07020]|uniref:C2H2-type domain-containing protein n=1 Tax=Endocarpon pusillum (strain Z07020 / HMAS-L-300199) TaxID=1263415 RepID=U1HPZ0_ENDPU|nr:uncharacterized protein EPUS_07689 [Endocarpon pusillum Z07020]ERF72480.1 hypothetical protein EPUS_07689 [Endocarpon pusillum Z07020]